METLVLSEPKKVQTVAEMAAADVRKAAVFKKFGIEFCCRGNKSLQSACNELNLDINVVEDALIKATTANKNYSFDFNRWQPDFLVDYIYNEHHVFFYEEYPVISKLLDKVAGHHGKNYPELRKAQELFATLERELIGHFAEEENMVFPLIKRLVEAKKNGTALDKTCSQKIDESLHLMQCDHEEAGDLLSELNKVTNGYNPPASACNSFRLLYHKLKSIEEDLHQHIHLENNILFPKTIALKKELVNLNLLQ